MTAERNIFPPALAKARDFCREKDMLPPAGGVMLCAVSGGRDSMALLSFLEQLAAEKGFILHAAHYNHMLRPTADRDEDFVRLWCADRHIPLACGTCDVRAWAREQGASLEDAARTLRYRFLEETADRVGAQRIATATMSRTMRRPCCSISCGAPASGAWAASLRCGEGWYAPSWRQTAGTSDAYVEENNIPYVEDESNADITFARNRLRIEVMPLLEKLAPGSTARIAGAAAILREEENHLAQESAGLLPPAEEDKISLPVNTLMSRDLAIRRRLVRSMAQQLGVGLTAAQTDAVLALGSGGFLDLPDGLQAYRQAHRLTLRRLSPPPEPLELHAGKQLWGGHTVRVAVTAEGLPPEGNSAALSADKITGPLTIAAWDGTGRLAVENGSRSIKRLFADQGIPADQREEHPALYCDGKPVAVLGVAVDWAFRSQPGEKTITVVWKRRSGAMNYCKHCMIPRMRRTAPSVERSICGRCCRRTPAL